MNEYPHEELIDDPEGAHLYIRDAGLWLFQYNSEGQYSAELFNPSLEDKNDTLIYSFNSSSIPGAISDGALIPDDQQRPTLHLAFFDEHCLNLETLETSVETPPPGVYDGVLIAIRDLLIALSEFFIELAVKFRLVSLSS